MTSESNAIKNILSNLNKGVLNGFGEFGFVGKVSVNI
jgi:hypothetical protein